MYKIITVLALAVFLLSGCSNVGSPSSNLAEVADGQATDIDETPAAISINEEEYALFRELQNEKDFSVSPEYHEIQILTWKFARACLSSDTKAMEACPAADAEVNATMDIFNNNLEFLILKGLQKKDGKFIVDYEFQPKDEDSYSYINMEIVREDGEWKVDFYGFGK